MSICRYSRSGARNLGDSSYVQPLVQNLVLLLNNGTWIDNGSTVPKTVIPNEGLLHLLFTKVIQVPAFQVSGLQFPGGLLDPFSFGSALSASGGGCTPAGTPGVTYCYDQCPQNYTGVGPVCWQDCPAGYTDTGAFCDAGSYPNGTGYTKLNTYGRGAGRSCLHGYGECDCNSDEDKWGLMCYPQCNPGYTAEGCCLCSRYACNPGDFDNGAGMCYPACKPGWTTPTGIVCENIFAKSTSTRGVGYMTTGQCGPNEDSTTIVPDNFLNVCYGGSGYANLDSLAGLGNLQVTSSTVTYDGCADQPNAKSVTIRLTTLATLNLNASFGFKVCLGIPMVTCDAWPSYDYTQTIPIDFMLDVVLTIPFTSDWATTMKLYLNQSTLQLQNFQTNELDWVDKIANVVLSVMNVAKGAADAAATVAGWFSDDAKQTIEDKFNSVYDTLNGLLPDLSNKLISAINTGALPLVPSDVVAKYCPIPEFDLLFAGDPCK